MEQSRHASLPLVAQYLFCIVFERVQSFPRHIGVHSLDFRMRHTQMFGQYSLHPAHAHKVHRLGIVQRDQLLGALPNTFVVFRIFFR